MIGEELRFAWTRALLISARLAAIAGDEERARRWLERANTVLTHKLPRDDAQFVEVIREADRVELWMRMHKTGQYPEPEDMTCPHRWNGG